MCDHPPCLPHTCSLGGGCLRLPVLCFPTRLLQPPLFALVACASRPRQEPPAPCAYSSSEFVGAIFVTVRGVPSSAQICFPPGPRSLTGARRLGALSACPEDVLGSAGAALPALPCVFPQEHRNRRVLLGGCARACVCAARRHAGRPGGLPAPTPRLGVPLSWWGPRGSSCARALHSAARPRAHVPRGRERPRGTRWICGLACPSP